METKILSLSGTGQSAKPAKKFIDLFNEFNRCNALELGHSQGTRAKYQYITNNLERFLKETDRESLSAAEITIPILKEFAAWLPQNVKSCNRTHISKHIYRTNKALDHAVLIGEIPYNPCAAYRVKREKNKEVIHLESPEFTKWITHQWESPLYTLVQDLYTFSCTTGISYADLFTYTVTEDKNGLWIESRRQKTRKPFYVPLWHEEFKIPLRIHEKYKGKFPHITNSFYNRILREMSRILGIEKYLTTHTGRKTFATLKDQSDWSLGPIASIMGIGERVCVSHYINPSKKKIVEQLLRRA